MMRRLLSLSIACTVVLLVAGSAGAAEDTIRRGFNVAEGGTLRLDARVGSVTIVTGGSGVAVEVVRKSRGLSGDAVLRNHRVDFEQRGNDVIISSDFDGLLDRRSRYDVDWNIRIPARYNVDVSTSGGSIRLADIGGTVDARTSGGSIQVSSATADVVARTSGGSIRIGDAAAAVDARTSGGSIAVTRATGDIIARTSGGSIRIDDAGGRVEAKTSGGSIHARFSGQPRGDSTLTTSGGGVTVALHPSIGVDLDARASGGGVRADVPVTVVGTIGRHSVQGQINRGGPKLVLRTSGGGIRVTSL